MQLQHWSTLTAWCVRGSSTKLLACRLAAVIDELCSLPVGNYIVRRPAPAGVGAVEVLRVATELAPSSGHDTVADIVAVPSVAEQPLPFLLPVWQRTWRVPNTLPPAAGDATFCPSILNGGTCASHMTANLVGGCAAMVIHAGRRTCLLTHHVVCRAAVSAGACRTTVKPQLPLHGVGVPR